MIAAGAVGELVLLLKSTLAIVQTAAATALAYIARDAVGGARCAVAAKVVPPLVKLLSPASGEAVQMSAAQALSTLCWNEANPPLVLAAGAVAPLTALLKSRSVPLQRKAALVLARLACNDESLLPIVSAGAIIPLVPLLVSSCSTTQGAALVVVTSLACHIAGSHAALVAAGAVPRLIEVLHSDCEAYQGNNPSV